MNKTEKELTAFSKAMLLIHGISDLLTFLHSEECEFLHVERINIILNDERLGEAVVYFFDANKQIQSDVVFHHNIDNYHQSYEENVYQLDGVDFYYSHPKLAQHPAYQNVRSYYKIPLDKQLGAIELINPMFDQLDGGENQFKLFNSMLVSFITHVLDHQHENTLTRHISNERDNYHILVDVTNAVISQSSKENLLTSLLNCLHPYFKIKELSIIETDKGRCIQRDGRIIGNDIQTQCFFFNDISGSVLDIYCSETIIVTGNDLKQLRAEYSDFNIENDIECLILAPLIFRRELVGKVAYMLSDAAQLQEIDIALMQQIAARVALSMHSLRGSQHSTHSQAKSTDILIEETYDHYQIFDDIISQSEVMSNVLDQVAMVASCDSTVLIEGETGTGKELIAAAIHKMSRRCNRQMIKMNCAAIPDGLFESELFGHERGAFTGAIKNRVGRFELADQSTLFLDEIGDLSLALQPKLLRVLQEHEIERVGHNQLINVDVRLVVATNVDLLARVEDKQFRSDLYFRMNIFPIRLPPLRDRAEDIPLLVKHFTRLISKKMGKNIRAITQESMRCMTEYQWPGNVRQLKNFIERSVILTRGEVLNAPVHELVGMGQPVSGHVSAKEFSPVAVHNNDETISREAIIEALKESNGIVAGPRGAAVKLGLKRTTLLSRMQKMEISSKDYLVER
ncbi:sigma 54-interacting transcriptional regulator [Vibrio sp. V28_P6S34P95]|uniref:sigma 54-interacting transcriptional regulator n=5 Tax=unclassified Vibrio TaxID=2614977 RepID=UPI0013737821|nr:sigma 54-interacting transcriptional regulator [Vibrio sp. V28_P6S34P95]NAW69525.1 AAA domain-containing protein [Vibrio sp. V28_P6S34P95]